MVDPTIRPADPGRDPDVLAMLEQEGRAALVMQEMIRKGFRDHVIADRDHPVYKLVATGGIVG